LGCTWLTWVKFYTNNQTNLLFQWRLHAKFACTSTKAYGCCACQFGMHSSHKPFVHAKSECLGMLCMPNWHAQQALGYYACQFGMHNIPRPIVHANLACTTGLFCMHNRPMVVLHAKLACTTCLGVLCMPIWHAQQP
jgi:hypothetical protein